MYSIHSSIHSSPVVKFGEDCIARLVSLNVLNVILRRPWMGWPTTMHADEHDHFVINEMTFVAPARGAFLADVKESLTPSPVLENKMAEKVASIKCEVMALRPDTLVDIIIYRMALHLSGAQCHGF